MDIQSHELKKNKRKTTKEKKDKKTKRHTITKLYNTTENLTTIKTKPCCKLKTNMLRTDKYISIEIEKYQPDVCTNNEIKKNVVYNNNGQSLNEKTAYFGKTHTYFWPFYPLPDQTTTITAQIYERSKYKSQLKEA